jgi:hypothetical protein
VSHSLHSCHTCPSAWKPDPHSPPAPSACVGACACKPRKEQNFSSIGPGQAKGNQDVCKGSPHSWVVTTCQPVFYMGGCFQGCFQPQQYFSTTCSTVAGGTPTTTHASPPALRYLHRWRRLSRAALISGESQGTPCGHRTQSNHTLTDMAPPLASISLGRKQGHPSTSVAGS